MHEFKIAQLKHFILVVEEKSFYAAAKKSFRTQPAISLSIKDLETKLGEYLFEKSTASKRSKSINLTPFGEYFYLKAKELVENHDRIIQDVQLLTNHKKGHLRLASVPSVATHFLPKLLADFLGDEQALNISIFDGSSEAVLAMVDEQKVDFGFASMTRNRNKTNKDFIPIWEDSVGIICAKDHPLTSLEKITWQDLRDYQYIYNGTSSLLKNTEAEELTLDTQYQVPNVISIIAILEMGFGLTTLPQYAFPKHNPNLAFLPLASPIVKRQVGIVTLKEKTLVPVAQAFYDFIIKNNKI